MGSGDIGIMGSGDIGTMGSGDIGTMGNGDIGIMGSEICIMIFHFLVYLLVTWPSW